MAKTVADQFAETLAAAGVKRIYGVVGDSLNGLTDSIRRRGKITGFTLYMVKAVFNGRADDLVYLAKSNVWD